MPANHAIKFIAALCAGLFAFAFAAAPSACEGGLTAYVWAGGVSALLAAGSSIVASSGRRIAARALGSIGALLAVALVWTVGLFAANVQIMCRLF